MKPVMSCEDIEVFLHTEFPQLGGRDGGFSVVEVAPGTASLQLATGDTHLRPGGTISGPTLFALADVAAYVAILAHIGPVALAVTTNLNINFLRRPVPGNLVAKANLLKLGKRLAVVEIAVNAEGDRRSEATGGELVAHATATYSIPPR